MNKQLEQTLLIQSAGLMGLLAVSGTVMGIVSGSSAILLDGICSFIGLIIKVMMLMTSKLVTKETSKRFQFGYWQFEPLILTLEGAFILTIVIYALTSGISDLLAGGRTVVLDYAIFYALFFLILDLIYYFYVKQINKKLQSNLIKYDNISWSIDAMLEFAILLSFVVAYGLEHTSYAHYARYVDPLVLIVLSLQMIPSSIRILVPSVKQIMGMAPERVHNDLQEIMDYFMEKYKFLDYVTSVQAYGKVRIIEIDILIPKSYPIQDVAELDGIRNEIDDRIGGKRSEKWVTISFTTLRRWMAKDYLIDEEEE